MAARDEVAQRRRDPAAVVGVDVARGHVGGQGALDIDERHVERGQLTHEVLVVLLHRAHHQRVDPAGAQDADVQRVDRRIHLGVHDEQRVPLGAQPPLGADRDVRDEVVREVVGDEPDRPRGAPPQALGQHVRLVAELLGRCQDALAHLGVDVRAPGQHARGRRKAHASPARDVADPDAAVPSLLGPGLPLHRPSMADARARSRAILPFGDPSVARSAARPSTVP